MDIACPNDASDAPQQGERARRIGQVKFVALVIDEPEPDPAPREPLSPSCAMPFPAWRAFLSRVLGRLVAARP